MQLAHLALLFLTVASIFGHPTKPLDERSTELAWQAWLLVQNNDTDGVSRKKVVPKSVFIAPEFDRPCPDGLQKDITGRCIKLHGLDTEGQLNFLFEKLSQHFDSGKSDEVSNQATPGPAQIHIPIPIRTVESIDEIVDGLTIMDSSKLVKSEAEEPNSAPVELPTTTTEAPEASTEAATTSTITDQLGQQEEQRATSTLPTTGWFTTDSPTITPMVVEDPDRITGTVRTHRPMPATDFTMTETPPYTEGTTSSTTYVFGDERPHSYFDHTDVSPILFRLPVEVPERQLEVGPKVVFGEDDAENVKHAANLIRFPEEIYESYRRPQRDQHYYNHRNRDKNIWKFNPPWRETPDSTLILVPKITNNNDVDLYKKLLYEQLSYLLRKNR